MERKKEEVEKAKMKEDEDRKWEDFMVGRGTVSRVAATSQEVDIDMCQGILSNSISEFDKNLQK